MRRQGDVRPNVLQTLPFADYDNRIRTELRAEAILGVDQWLILQAARLSPYIRDVVSVYGEVLLTLAGLGLKQREKSSVDGHGGPFRRLAWTGATPRPPHRM